MPTDTRPRRRQDIGEVVFPIERMLAAREISSCCVGVEALLETDARAIEDRLRIRLARDDGTELLLLEGICVSSC